MKKAFVFLMVFSLFFITVVSAESWRVFDNAGLLTDEEIEAIEQAICEFQRDTNYDFAFLTTDDYLGKNSIEIAKAFLVAENLGFGQQGSGVLYYLATYDGKIKPSVVCSGDMCSIFDIEERSSALAPCDDFIRQGDYKNAVLTMLSFALDSVNNAE